MSISSVLGRHAMVTALLLIAGVAIAQTAQEAPKNLQVLPEDWTRPQVIQVMQNFGAALGVGCDHCHRGVPVPKQLSEILAKTSAEQGFAAASAQ
jgi:hypothetical protein